MISEAFPFRLNNWQSIRVSACGRQLTKATDSRYHCWTYDKRSVATEPNLMTIKNVARLSGLMLGIAAAVYGGLRLSHVHLSNSAFLPATSRGHQAPNFALSTPDGKIVHLSDYQGKAVLLNFFGNTCEPCLQESPWLVEIKKRDAEKGFEIIGVEMYGASNDEIKSYAKQFGTNYVLVHGDQAVASEYGIGSFPTSYFLNARGTIVAATVGLHSEKETEGNVQTALAAN
jgi:peroxiredoxin